jgi:hypothetical protein
MKINQILGIGIMVTNEEQQFIDRHNHHVKISSLDDHDQWVAQNLVRKGIYEIGHDNMTLINKLDEQDEK